MSLTPRAPRAKAFSRSSRGSSRSGDIRTNGTKPRVVLGGVEDERVCRVEFLVVHILGKRRHHRLLHMIPLENQVPVVHASGNEVHMRIEELQFRLTARALRHSVSHDFSQLVGSSHVLEHAVVFDQYRTQPLPKKVRNRECIRDTNLHVGIALEQTSERFLLECLGRVPVTKNP